MVEVALDTPEHFPGLKTQAAKQRVERRHAGKTGAAGPEIHVLSPEHVGPSRLFVRIRHLGMAQDLGSGLERHSRVEAREESLEKPNARLGARKIEGFENLINPEIAHLLQEDVGDRTKVVG